MKHGCLIVSCAHSQLALPVESVVEVARMVAPCAKLLRAPRYVMGIVDFHGQLVPLVDLPARLGLCAPRTPTAMSSGHIVFLYLGDVQALGQEADAPVDLAQPLLAVQVVAVLGAVAVLGRPRHDLDDLGPLDVEQIDELGTQPPVALRREVVARAGRQRRRGDGAVVVVAIVAVGLAGEGLVHGGGPCRPILTEARRRATGPPMRVISPHGTRRGTPSMPASRRGASPCGAPPRSTRQAGDRSCPTF